MWPQRCVSAKTSADMPFPGQKRPAKDKEGSQITPPRSPESSQKHPQARDDRSNAVPSGQNSSASCSPSSSPPAPSSASSSTHPLPVHCRDGERHSPSPERFPSSCYHKNCVPEREKRAAEHPHSARRYRTHGHTAGGRQQLRSTHGSH